MSASATAHAATPAPESTAADAPSAVAPPTAAALEKQEKVLAERRESLEELLKNAAAGPSPSAGVEMIQQELAVVKYYELVCSQHREELSRGVDLAAAAAQWKTQLHDLELAGPEESKPYPLLLLDDLQDQLAATQSLETTLTTELSLAKEMQQAAHRMHDEAETKRRKLKEALETTSADEQQQSPINQLEVAELNCQLFAELIRLRRTEIANKELDAEINQVRGKYVTAKRDAVARDVVFTLEQLQMVLGELDKVEADLRAQISPLQAKLQEVATREKDSQPKQEVADRELREAMAEGWQQARQNLKLQITMIEQRLRELVMARTQWNVRFKVFNHQATPEQRAEWTEAAKLYHDRLQAGRQLLEDQSKALLAEMGRRERQVRILRNSQADVAPWVEYQISCMRDLSQAYATNLVKVEMLERMLSKVYGALEIDSQPTGAADWLTQARLAVATVWNYELTSVDDRPITVRKIATGLVLLLLGVYASRQLSRLIGKRILPRLGLNSGVATAVQSVSFYLLVTCFAFMSLELINIPLTVFTFLGGAMAIGIGFGSQNILNNFISGLILLAEQPIRVGDLVDINGLCGNVEKIGARSTRVKTGTNLEIIVPNSKFLQDNVTNWTLSDTRMRTVVRVGVAYGSPTSDVDRLLRAAVATCSSALPTPEPIVLFSDFGDNSLMFEVHFWTDVRSMMQARKAESELRHAIDQLMREANITIAFPQRDIHLDTLKPLEVHVRQLAAQETLSIRRKSAA
jgi:small-conductance mechanosensitive channel